MFFSMKMSFWWNTSTTSTTCGKRKYTLEIILKITQSKYAGRIKGLKLRRNSGWTGSWTGNWIGAAPGPRRRLPRRWGRGGQGKLFYPSVGVEEECPGATSTLLTQESKSNTHTVVFGLKPRNFHRGENFGVEGSFPLVIYLLPMAGKYE